ncbi:hypothetical protein M3P05_13260 [Sansalvadorimonas sp. 2012CJ34-2]|uniref:Uncharacterized protein n=1 Tax=Parendozoicomonas callyspongiae TaxID=2942213 RepID=A0ABT0PJH4_9GAMM|nr:hypothetical protein [Sansalvadorimonas sp. 2012CJ34-2]MCL6270892.1 hypothetical protein [Sansalvadorimonas sp. 2012CJ34-2]
MMHQATSSYTGASYSRTNFDSPGGGSSSYPGRQTGYLASQEQRVQLEKFKSLEKRVIECLNAVPYGKAFDDKYEQENKELYEQLRKLECVVCYEIDPGNSRILSCCNNVVSNKWIISSEARRLSLGRRDNDKKKWVNDDTVLCPICRENPDQKYALRKRATLSGLPGNVSELIEKGLRRRLIEPMLNTVKFNGKHIDTSEGIFEVVPGDESAAKKMRQSTSGQPVEELKKTGVDKVDYVSFHSSESVETVEESFIKAADSDDESSMDVSPAISSSSSTTFERPIPTGSYAQLSRDRCRLFSIGGTLERRHVLSRRPMATLSIGLDFFREQMTVQAEDITRDQPPAQKRPKLTPANEKRRQEIQRVRNRHKHKHK